MISPDYKAIRSKLRDERKRRKLTQIKLAKKLGVSNVTLCCWETLGPPSFDKLAKWANELGFSLMVERRSAGNETAL